MQTRVASPLLFLLFCAVPLAAQDVYLPSATVSAPVAIKTTRPQFPNDGNIRRVTGDVKLQVDVRPDGTVGTVALVKSMDAGFDEEAVKAARQWLFRPGLKDGRP